MVIGIIGGGASGMAAALAAAENEHVQVVLLERQARVGRKLLATGNGRCNLTNLKATGESYHGDAPSFAKSALEQFNVQATLAWFSGLGLYTVAEDTGRVYPYSDQANSVVDVLRLALDKPNIRLVTGFEVKKAVFKDGLFQITDGNETVSCDKLIIACGGLAGSKLGGTMSGYQLLAKFGHKSTKLRPALVQLKSPWTGLSALKGIRANCHVRILKDDVLFAQSNGEIQFTEYGLSGPVIFEISRDVCRESAFWSCCLDLLPDWTPDMLQKELLRRRETNLPVDELLTGILHNRLGRVLTRVARVRNAQFCRELTDENIENVCAVVKEFCISLLEPMGMDSAQVTAGGVMTDGFDPDTMESRIQPGLYACGEVLDIDGDCGGFNLQWAWSSGRCAGISAGKDVK